ncbi:MAG: imidazole glycerol phosphate synthase subunit HisH [Sulfolobaceae archaeon]
MMAFILNYGVGNIFSVKNALERVGFNVKVTNDVKGIKESQVDLIVFPGVGAYRAVSSYILSNINTLNNLKDSGVGFLGICLGMQVMFEEGTEGGRSKGLGWFKGIVDKLPTNLKLPHIGWDRIYAVRYSELTEGLEGRYVYYVHSFIAFPKNKEIILMESEYGIRYPAIVAENKIVGTQFHPEKSSNIGKIFFNNLIRWLKR